MDDRLKCLLAGIVLLGSDMPGRACDGVVVGRLASVDGSVLVGHNEENALDRVIEFRKINGMRPVQGARVALRRGGSVEAAPETCGFLWSENPGLEFSDGYLNECGVAIVSIRCASREDDYDALVSRGEIREGGIGYMLRRIVAQQARSAREGMEWIGRLVERFGYVDTGRTYVVADPTEAWVVEVVRGPRWVAQRVPDDAVVVLPARHVIGEIDLGVPARFRAAPDLIPYAVRRGWYDPGAGRPFNFRLAYQTPEHVAPEGRQFRGQAIVSGKPGRWPTSDPLPFAVHPHKRLSAADVAAILRDDRGVARFYNESTQEAAVFQLRPGLPRPIGCVYWRTTGRPDVSVLTPWHAGITETPAIYGPRDAPARLLSITRHFEPSPSVFQPDPTLAWWKFKRLTEVVDRSYAERIGPVRTRWAEMERRLWREVSEVEARALALWSADQDGARALLTRFCREQALAACAEAERFARVLAAPAGS